MATLGELAKLVRSKNAGPFTLVVNLGPCPGSDPDMARWPCQNVSALADGFVSRWGPSVTDGPHSLFEPLDERRHDALRRRCPHADHVQRPVDGATGVVLELADPAQSERARSRADHEDVGS